jgi:hypothetical protein
MCYSFEHRTQISEKKEMSMTHPGDAAKEELAGLMSVLMTKGTASDERQSIFL